MLNNAPRVLLFEDTNTNRTTVIDVLPLLRIQRAFERARDVVIMARDKWEGRLGRDPFVDSLIKNIRKATSRKDLRALWTRQALSRHRAVERRRRAVLDPSELAPGEFRRMDRACGSSWRVTLR